MLVDHRLGLDVASIAIRAFTADNLSQNQLTVATRRGPQSSGFWAGIIDQVRHPHDISTYQCWYSNCSDQGGRKS